MCVGSTLLIKLFFLKEKFGLRIGIPGLRKEIEEAMSACDNPEKAPFYRSLLLYCDNMADLCRRYAEKARDMQLEEVPQSRRDELSKIAEICDSVSIRPPRSFREALQLFWFTFLLDGNDDPGRFDQFMFPFYRDDLAKGRITREFARELLEELYSMRTNGRLSQQSTKSLLNVTWDRK